MWRKLRARTRARRLAKPLTTPTVAARAPATPPSSRATATPPPATPSQPLPQPHPPSYSTVRPSSPTPPPAKPTHSTTPHPPRPRAAPLARSPSLPHGAPPPPAPSAEPLVSRARTDIGTRRDTSLPAPVPKRPAPALAPQAQQPVQHMMSAPLLAPPHPQPQPHMATSLPPARPVLKVTPTRSVGPATSHERNRRLSLDGDLPAAALRPDDSDSLRDDRLSEGLFEVSPMAFSKHPIDVSACSKAGWEPVRTQPASVPPTHTVEVRKENQDAFCVFAPFTPPPTVNPAPPTTPATSSLPARDPPRQIFLGVFDGHGAEGRPIAHHARDFIAATARTASPSLLSRLPPAAPIPRDIHRARLDLLKAAFSRAERTLIESDPAIDHLFSGTTAVVAWLFGPHLYTAWTGDSRCVLGRAVSTADAARPRFRAIDTSHDQKPVRPDEKRRVRGAGGRIARWQRNLGPLRVWLPRDWTPGLAMTRSIGDTVLSEFGVSPVPEVTYTHLAPPDAFIVLASDGVWEFMTSQEVVDFIGRMRREGRSAADASEALVREAVRRWRRNEVVVDDTTAVVMWMNWRDDTHGDSDASVKGRHGAANDGASAKPRKVFSMTRAKHTLKPAANVAAGVHLLGDDGQLGDFVCKNDLFQGI